MLEVRPVAAVWKKEHLLHKILLQAGQKKIGFSCLRTT